MVAKKSMFYSARESWVHIGATAEPNTAVNVQNGSQLQELSLFLLEVPQRTSWNSSLSFLSAYRKENFQSKDSDLAVMVRELI